MLDHQKLDPSVIEEVYPVPPEDFCKKLFQFDRNLQLNFDPGQGVWSVWHRHPDTGEFTHVMNVVEDDGSYRPLDGRVFLVLERNRFFANNPDELEKVLCDDLESEMDRQKRAVHDDVKHLSKDRSLKKEFLRIKDLAGSISQRDWESYFKRKENAPV